MLISYTVLVLLGLGLSEAQRQPCIPVSSNLTTPDSADDVPAVRATLEECGNGGTILFPSKHLYQIGSTLDLSLCHGCTIQIDGTLNVSALDAFSKWSNQPGIFQLAGASNVTITGSGLINGKDWDPLLYFTPTAMFNLTRASNIRISGLTIRSPRANIFYIRNSRDIQASSLSLATNLDPKSPVTYSSWVHGFDISDSSHIEISSQTAITGVSECITIRDSVNSTSVSDVSCASDRGGVYINLESAHYGDVSPLSNLSFTNLTIEGAYWATGIIARGGTVTAENVTWQNVRVHGVMRSAYVQGCGGSGCYGPSNPGVTFKTRNVTFTHFEGQSKAKQYFECPQLAGAQCDFQAVDFNVEVTSCPQC